MIIGHYHMTFTIYWKKGGGLVIANRLGIGKIFLCSYNIPNTPNPQYFPLY